MKSRETTGIPTIAVVFNLRHGLHVRDGLIRASSLETTFSIFRQISKISGIKPPVCYCALTCHSKNIGKFRHASKWNYKVTGSYEPMHEIAGAILAAGILVVLIIVCPIGLGNADNWELEAED